MIHTKDHKTGYLFDPWDHLGPKRRKLLEQSWAGLFREHILQDLPVNKIARYFTEGFGRPTKELYMALGVIILQQAHDITDDETLCQLAFSEQWHYALDITSMSDDATYMSPKTLWNMRKIVTDNELDSIIFNQTTDTLAKVFNVDISKQRLDSVHIRSNMRSLGRIRIFAVTIRKFLVNLKRHHKGFFETIDERFIDRYLTKDASSCFSMVKPSESAKTLETVSSDLFELVQLFRDNTDIVSMNSYKLMERVLKEQCIITDTDNDKTVTLKKPKDIPSDSLQNPSDPDATYDGHKGQGYQVQIMETYTEKKKKKTNEESENESESVQEDDPDAVPTLNLITHVDVQAACESDANALIPAIESAEERNLAPDELLTDSLYGSDDSCETAKELGTEVVAPTMGSQKEDVIPLSDFTFSEKGKVISCPEGHTPVSTKHKKNRHIAAFKIDCCSNCPRKDKCPVKAGEKYYYLRYKDKVWRIAMRRAYEKTDEFKDKYRWRAGIEATMSEYDRKTGVKNLRVRGMEAVRFCATLKAVGINIFRATVVRRAKISPKPIQEWACWCVSRLCFYVKEQLCTHLRILGKIFSESTFSADFSCRSTG
ncbi:MAG: transposase [Thermodesulfobacteriota bacterium]|nr:transposase [Thermodesulfobacteriota bacterium]